MRRAQFTAMILAVLTGFVSCGDSGDSGDPVDAKKKRLAKLIAEQWEYQQTFKDNPKADDDPEIRLKMEKWDTQIIALTRELVGDDDSKWIPLYREVVRKYAPHIPIPPEK